MPTKTKEPTLTVGAMASAASIWKLVERDRSTTGLHLLPDGSVYVAGMYCEARRNGVRLGIDKPMIVSGRHLTGVLGLMPDDAKVKMTEAQSSLVLTAGGHRAVLLRSLAEEPPPITVPDKKFVPLTGIKQAVRFLAPLTPPAGVPVELIGIAMTPGKDGVTLTATDGHVCGRAATDAIRVKEQRVVPASDLAAALSLVGDEGWVGIAKTPNGERCVVRDERTVISMSLLNGQYPDVDGALPQKFRHKLPIDRDALATAVQAARLLDEDGLVVLAIKDKRARWRVQGQDVGGFRLGAGRVDLPDIEIGLAATYLERVLDAGDGLTMRYNEERSAVRFDSKETGFRLWLAQRRL